MAELVVSDAYRRLQEEVEELQLVLAALTSERDDLRYHICPELEARFAQEIGCYQDRLNYQDLMIREMKRRIEIARAALNRRRSVSQEEVDRQIHEEYRSFHEKVDEAFRKSEQARREQREKEARQQTYKKRWQEQYGSRSAGSNASYTGAEDHGEEEGRDQPGAGKSRNIPNAKELYRKIIKKLHPDMNPDITEHEKDLFNRAVKAYREGDIATLQEIYDEIFGEGTMDVRRKALTYEELLILREKLQTQIRRLQAQIDQIKQDFPYNMKTFLEDEAAVKRVQDKLNAQIHQNEETLKRLTAILEEINREMEKLGKQQA